jgi:hypothetical protein
LADHFHAGRALLVQPTLKQSAMLAGVPVAALYAARRARKPAQASLADRIRSASPAELVEAAKAVGCDVIWDRMLMPIIGNGTAPAA